LPLAAVFDSSGMILAQILPTSPGPASLAQILPSSPGAGRIAWLAQILPSSPGSTRLASLAPSGRAYGGARCESAPALQEIGRGIATSSRARRPARSSGTRSADCAGRRTGNVEEII
jgi:hypothetical protein